MDEYTFLLINEVASQTNATLDEVHFLVSRHLEANQLAKKHISNSGLVVDLLACTGGRKIGFVLTTTRNYCREPAILDGESQFQLDMLQMSGIHPIVVDCTRWNVMSDGEKEHFIKNEIYFAR